MEIIEKCGSCNREITNQVGVVKIKCPNCGETEVIRCPHCRIIVSKYKCKQCGFEGP